MDPHESRATNHDPQFTLAVKAAIAFLKSRERFMTEVRSHLLGKGFEDATANEVLSYLAGRKLLNDNETMQRFIERHSGKRSVGAAKLSVELERMGAPPEIVETHITALRESETERALDALRAKFRAGAERAKAGRFLYSRGFTEEAIEAALDAFCLAGNE